MEVGRRSNVDKKTPIQGKEGKEEARERNGKKGPVCEV